MIKNEYRIDGYGNAIVKGREGHDINYGELRTITTESGMVFVTAISNYGYIVEAFWCEALTLSPYEGEGNFNLTIQVGDQGSRGSVTLWLADNKDVDRLCRQLNVDMEKRVTVESHARILATYGGGKEPIRKSLDEFYTDISPEMLEMTSWHIPRVDYDFIEKYLSNCFRRVESGSEDGEYVEYWWIDWDERLVATAVVDNEKRLVEEFSLHYYNNEQLSNTELLTLVKCGRY